MECKDWVKKREKFGKGADCKEEVKEEERIGKAEFCKVLVKRRENSGKGDFCEDGVKPARKAGKAAAGGRIAGSIGRAVAAKRESRNPTGSIRRKAARNARGRKRQPQAKIGGSKIAAQGRQHNGRTEGNTPDDRK